MDVEKEVIIEKWSIVQDKFLQKLEDNMEDLDPEYIKLVDDNFWDLI